MVELVFILLTLLLIANPSINVGGKQLFSVVCAKGGGTAIGRLGAIVVESLWLDFSVVCVGGVSSVLLILTQHPPINSGVDQGFSGFISAVTNGCVTNVELSCAKGGSTAIEGLGTEFSVVCVGGVVLLMLESTELKLSWVRLKG